MNQYLFLCFAYFLLLSCQQEETSSLFRALTNQESSITFKNHLNPTEDLNMYVFKNYYNGGGVAVGDINNDGLLDLYFTGNEVSNQLYLNQGDLKFTDITKSAGVACQDVWSTGACFVDINQDGFLDLYVCKSGPPDVKGIRHNELFINNGDNTFSESSTEYGLDFTGLGVHAAFLDYDKDGDLDCYLLNNSIRSVGGYDLIKDQRDTPSKNGNKLLQNQEGQFIDISTQAGIYTSDIGFGLGVTVGDINQDGWEDLYVSNDYFEKDYLYINQKDGRFSEELESYLSEISMSSMGADLADLNNDSYPDLFVTDMLPEDLSRYRTATNFMSWNQYRLQENNGYFKQFVRNSFQLNQDGIYFQEISRMSNVSATDWSWGALIFDMNNDGNKDIFVANGIAKDLTDQDYVNFYANRSLVLEKMKENESTLIQTLMSEMPSKKIPNYAFINNGAQLPIFENQAKSIGLGAESFTSGSSYADLDNDGDLDLILNHVNDVAEIYENRSTQNYIKFDFSNHTVDALGAKVYVWSNGTVQYQEVAPYRGFQSCVDPRPNFGLGSQTKVDSVLIIWPNQTQQIHQNLEANTTYQFQQDTKGIQSPSSQSETKKLFTKLDLDLPKHIENSKTSFDQEILLLKTRSAEGPRLASYTSNDKLFVYQPGATNANGKLISISGDQISQAPFGDFADSFSEEVNAHFFDANGDQLMDLYICNGSDEFSANQYVYHDALYIQQKDHSWIKSNQKFSKSPTIVARSNDIDSDGDLDLLVAPRQSASSTAIAASPEIWLNDGQGQFNLDETWSASITIQGFVTDALFYDINQDGVQELVMVSEWGSPSIFKPTKGEFQPMNLPVINGLWNRVFITDIGNDGDFDIVLGNLGLNSAYKATQNQPLQFYHVDVDQNGQQEQFIAYSKDGEGYTYTLRNELVSAVPAMRKNYLKFSDYKSASMTEILGKEIHPDYEVTELRSGYLEQENGQFTFIPFPNQAQVSPVMAITRVPGTDQLVLGGNYSQCKPQIGAYHANKGVVLTYETNQFQVVPASKTGLLFKEVRDFTWINTNDKVKLMVSNNNDNLEIYEFNDR